MGEYYISEEGLLTWFPALVWGWPRCFLRRTRGAYESLRLLQWSSAAGMAAAESKHSHHPPLEAACQRVKQNASVCVWVCVCRGRSAEPVTEIKNTAAPTIPRKTSPLIRPSSFHQQQGYCCILRDEKHSRRSITSILTQMILFCSSSQMKRRWFIRPTSFYRLDGGATHDSPTTVD